MKMKIKFVTILFFLLTLGAGAGLAQKRPTNADGWFRLGNGNAEYFQSAEAIADYTKAIRLNPKFAEAYYARAEVYRRQTNELGAALADYKKAFKLAPAAAHEFRPVFESLRAKDTTGAIGTIDALIKDEPMADPLLYYMRGLYRAAAAKGNSTALAAALEDCDRALALVPKSPALADLRAKILAEQNKTADALPTDIADLTNADSDKLLAHPVIKSRLEKLLGAKNYAAFLESFETLAPVEKNGNLLFSSGCLIHACTHLESAIAIDLTKNTIHAAIYDEEKKTAFFNERGSRTPKAVTDWANRLSRLRAGR